MRIKTLMITILTAATLSVLALVAVGLSSNRQLSKLSLIEKQTQAASHDVNALLIFAHEYALYAEPRAAYQWQKNLDGLLQKLAEQETAPVEISVQAFALRELFAQLIASNASADSKLKEQRNHILLDQLLSNTQALSDQFHSWNKETSAKRDDAQYIYQLTGLAIPLISLLALLFTLALLTLRVLRPLEVMRKAVEAVAQGDPSVRSDTATQDEFGELSRAFDTMALDLVSLLRQEIIERRQIEDNLQLLVDERTASLKAIVDTAADGIITIDKSGAIISINHAAEQLFGYSAEETIGKNVSMLMPETYQRSHDNHIQKYRETGQSKIMGKGRELTGQHKNGQQFPIYISLSEVVLANETRFTAIVRDITRQKQTEHALTAARDEAERANRAKSEFLSSMSHELRTPMNAILGYSQLMNFDETLSVQNRENVKEILGAGEHLLSLIKEVLDLSRIESGHINLLLEPVELCPVVEECLRLVSTMADKRDIRISHRGLQGTMIRADRVKLRQVLLNLLSNALKYNRDGGTVRLEVQQQKPDRICILVSDSGRGVAADRLHELFQPFNRLDADKSNIEGTGIGLTITQRLVEMMGGTIGVESELGVGSTFCIELPVEDSDEPVQQADRTNGTDNIVHGTSQDSMQKTILYIEDNPANLKLVAQILGKRKHIRLLTAHTPELGIELARLHLPDIILLDINMPGMDGYQVLEIFKADAGLSYTPVIAVTANAMPRDIEKGLAAGFNDYLTKPLNVQQMLKKVDEILLSAEQ